MPDVSAVDLPLGIVTMQDGTSARIVSMMDAYGEDTDDADDAVCVIIQDAQGGRMLVKLGEPEALH
jgi:hypothetical protein